MAPVVPHELRTILQDAWSAAHTYAENGWYVLPIAHGKHPGSVLGQGWPEKSSRDHDVINEWFDDSRHGVALHVGRSGAVAFDVDEPDHLPQVLLDLFSQMRPVFQSTRVGVSAQDHCRGHYLFALPRDGDRTIELGNALGRLRTDPKWGDVRGTNGIIVVSPTLRPEVRKRYHWVTTGELPTLPKHIARLMLNLGQRQRQRGREVDFDSQNRRIAALSDMVDNADVGERNSVLFWVACRIGEMEAIGALSARDAADISYGMARLAIERGLREREATATVDSGLRSGRWVMS